MYICLKCKRRFEEIELEGGEEQLVAVFGQHVGGKVRPVGLALEKSLE